MSEKTLEEKVQKCEQLNNLPIPLDMIGKKLAGCSSPEVQAELAKKKQSQDLIKGGSAAIRGNDPRSAALKDLSNS